MNKSTKTVLAVVLLLAILLVAVGFAAITATQLQISGTAQAGADDKNFTVEFTDAITKKAYAADGTTELTEGVTITAAKSDSDSTMASIAVTGLTAKDQSAVVTYTVQNASADLSATLGNVIISNDNEDYFDVSAVINNNTTPLAAGGAVRTITVTVKLKKTPIDETAAQLLANIGVKFTATPVQPTV